MNSKISFLVLLAALISQSSFAQTACGIEKNPETRINALIEQFRNSIDPEAVQSTLVLGYSGLVGRAKTAGDSAQQMLEKVLPMCALEAIASDLGERYYQKRLTKVIALIQNDLDFDFSETAFKTILEKSLVNQVAQTTIEARVSNFFKPVAPSEVHLTKRQKRKHPELVAKPLELALEERIASLKQVLGEIDRNELLILIHGGDPLNPTPESLIGQYIERTGAKTVVRTFEKNPTTHEKGETKLVIALSSRSMAVYKELFSRPEFLIHFHTPGQGTLYIMHEGKTGSYMELNGQVNDVQEGSLLPHIALKSSEAERMMLLRELGSNHNNLNDLREPWNLKIRGENGRDTPYCGAGGYDSCTHWFGDLPLGDDMVDHYKFPGRVDQYAHNYNSPNIRGPQITEMKAYSLDQIKNYLSYHYIRDPKQQQDYAKLISLVWGNTGTGHMQLSEMFGPTELQANLDGEYANPGYVAYRLTGNVSNVFVPFVFLGTYDHTRAIRENFDTQIRAY